MRIESIQITNENKLIQDYRNQNDNLLNYFDYTYNDFSDRLLELKGRTFQRENLVNVLYSLNKEWGAPESTLQNIERLKAAESVVVVGGQQAGVLTGPLYSVNKVISIIQLAKQQEKLLNIPVIPVFWIAGEDHDFEEINHVYMMTKARLKKYRVNQFNPSKTSISDIALQDDEVNAFISIILNQLPETQYTNEIKLIVQDCLEKSSTYVDFFARLIFQLFNQDGLVLLDSGDKRIRKLESNYFIEMIKNQKKISQSVFNTQNDLMKQGYTIPLDVNHENGHLFYCKDDERILLNRNEEGNWVGKQLEVILTNEELLQIAKDFPEKLSNNVVTRPIMQDLLLPTLAFIGGPGEISYWSVLKGAFHTLNIKMPPVVPRLSLTYIDRKINKLLNKYNISLESAINGEISSIRKLWFKEKVNPPIEDTADEIKNKIAQLHEPLRNIAKIVRADLEEMADKNLDYLIKDIEFLEKRIIRALEERYEKELSDFSLLEMNLYPNGLQERIWNPIPYINCYGINFFQEVNNFNLSFQQDHFIVYI
ncbi:bacillithiol biosynthesis cysteine-adding enzyme BshC [Ornithinibacillus halotolerans]|uniref:Putative cysteine ligase BshC n=1 Tax=Ornithinibacillus halotolerans TaxID=1274357 RepID=A0A916S4A7_9BACI|nr:bacillithiol biosynthesis cysteine-adding enzyme BshC [Ornithinibacillus halotolerans]GGA83843.1 putative cysteine ligase BshC [Ornithinibacillus halotolerans]